MARDFNQHSNSRDKQNKKKSYLSIIIFSLAIFILLILSPLSFFNGYIFILIFLLIPLYFFIKYFSFVLKDFFIELERKKESKLRNNKEVIGMPPQRNAFQVALKEVKNKDKKIIDKYLVGFSLDDGEPLWVSDNDICSHACVFAKTGVGKTLWMESLIFQQMARGRASGATFIDAKRDSGTLAQIILMAIVTGRIEDVIVIDPFDQQHSYNFVLTNQRADVKARKILRAGLPPTSDQSSTKHYDRLASDSIYRLVRAMESLGLSWSINDIAVALSSFQLSYPHLKSMLEKINSEQALVELGHLASSYRNAQGNLDTNKLNDNLRGIASELHAISGSEMGSIFTSSYTDLNLTDAILRGKIIYFMLPRLEEAESASRMVKLFREDLEVSIGEITSSRNHHLEDPHLVVIDEGSSTFGPTWANLFELARKGRFALLFGAQSTGGLTDTSLGLSEAFYERVMANVNLKVMMRVGDNRTAQDMADWFGKVSSTTTSVGAGFNTSKSGSKFDASSRSSDGQSENISITETEEYYVSPEELKHEMSAEKGLAWFDLGDGRIIKGRSLWFNAEIPETWEGREYLTDLERYERDELGLAKWVDKQILNQERTSKDTEKKSTNITTNINQNNKIEKTENSIEFTSKEEIESKIPFKLDLNLKKTNIGNVNTIKASEIKTPLKETKKNIKKSKNTSNKGKFPTGNLGIRKKDK